MPTTRCGPPRSATPRTFARFRAAIASCRDLNAKRNRLIHGAWVDGLPMAAPGYLCYAASGGQPWPSAEEVRLQDIEGLADDLAAAVSQLVTASFEVEGIIAGT